MISRFITFSFRSLHERITGRSHYGYSCGLYTLAADTLVYRSTGFAAFNFLAIPSAENLGSEASLVPGVAMKNNQVDGC